MKRMRLAGFTDCNPRRNRWVILTYMVLMQAITVGISLYCFAFFVMPWTAEFHTARSTMMLAIVGLSLVSALINPMCGYAIDLLSSKRLLLGGALIFAAGLLGIAFAANYTLVIILFACALPFGACLAGPLMAYAVIARLFTHDRGFAMGVTAVGTNVGGILMPLLVTQLLGYMGWRPMFEILAALVMVIVVLPGLVLLVDEPSPAATAHAPSRGSLRTMFTWPVICLAIAYLAPAVLFIAVLHNIGLLAEDLSITARKAAWITASASLLMAIGKIAVGALSDRVNSGMLYVVLIGVMVAGVVLVSVAASFWALISGVGLIALVQGGTTPLMGSIIAKRWGTANFGRVMGIVYAVSGLSAIGPMIAGFIRDTSGSYSEAFIWLLLGLIPALYCFLLPPRSALAPEPA